MSAKELKNARNIVAAFIEETGADAVVVIYSKVRRGKTSTFIVPFGNAHTCNALIDYAYEVYDPPELDLAAEEVDDDE